MMFKKLLVTLLSISVISQSFAGLPPTSVKGQSDASPQTKFQFQVPFSQKTDLGGIKALFETGNKNVLVNGSFDNTTYSTGWTVVAGGSTASQDTTNFTDGTAAFLMTSPGGPIAGFSLTQDVTPTQQFGGKAIEASCWVKNTISALTPQLCARSAGSNLTSSCTTLPTDGNWHQVQAGVTTAVTGSSVGLQITVGTSPSAGTLDVDECYVGEARNIGSVQQSGFIGDIRWTTPSFAWTNTGITSFTNYSAATGSPTNVVTGLVTAPSTNIPGVKLASMPPGDYMFVATGAIANYSSGGGQAFIRFTDGTNNSTATGFLSGSSASTPATTGTVIGHIVETTAQSNVTIQMQSTSNVSADQQVMNASSNPLDILVYYFPTSAQQVFTANTSPANWTGTSTLNATTASTTLADINTALAGTVTTTSNQNITCVAASGQLGFTCTLPSTGMYNVCYSGYTYEGSAGSWYQEITDSSNVVVVGLQNGYSTYSSGGTFPTGACGNYLATSTTATFKTRGCTSSGTQSPSITSFSIVSLNTPVSAPIVYNSITTNASAAWRHEAAIIGSTGGITQQSGTWLSSATMGSSGVYTLNFAAGMWSAAPMCVCNAFPGSIQAMFCETIPTTTTSQIFIDTGYASATNSAMTASQVAFTISCDGPR